MLKLREQLKSLLKPHFPNVIVDGNSVSRVHYQTATNKSVFPYVVFDFPNSFIDEQQEIFSLDIDIWDNNEDTTELETLASTIWKELNYYRYIDNEIQFSVYRENRLPPLDEDEINIKRRKLIFTLKYYDRGIFE